MSVIILDAKAMYLKVMGATPPSSLDQKRCYSGGNLSFLSNYRCSAQANQLVNNGRLYPKRTLLFSPDSPEDAYGDGEQVAVLWENTAWSPTGSTPMAIDSTNTLFYFDDDRPSFIAVDNGYYMEMSGATRRYYHVSSGRVDNIGTYTPSASESCAVNLQSMWMPDSSLNVGGYLAYKSQANWHQPSSRDVALVTFSGYSTFRCFIRSYAESNYDYAMVSALNASSYPTAYTDSSCYAHTRGNQQAGTSLADYTEVTFDGLDPGSTYTFYVVYRKDSSTDSNADEGYILLPSITTSSNPYIPPVHPECLIERITDTPINVSATATTKLIQVRCTTDGANRYLSAANVRVLTDGIGVSVGAASSSGTVSITLTFPANWQQYSKTCTFEIVHPDDNTKKVSYSLVQAAAAAVTYYFEILTGSEITIPAEGAYEDMYVLSYKVENGVETFLDFSVQRADQNIQFDSLEYGPDSMLSDILCDAVAIFNSHSGGQTVGSLILVQAESGEAIPITVTRSASASDQSCSVDLQNNWSPDANLNVGGLLAFKSGGHKGEHSSYDVAKVTISGYTSFSLFIRSYAEYYADYTLVSKLDVENYPTAYTDSSCYAHTRGNQQAGTSLADYTEVTFDGLDGGRHTFYVVYRKDASLSINSDEGYMLLPPETTHSNPF